MGPVLDVLVGTTVYVGDCEARVGRFWEQGVNSWSALAYVGAAVVLAWAVPRHRLPVSVLVLAAAVVLVGVGSVTFHGTPGDVSHAIHDVGLFALVGHLVGWHVGRLRGSTETWSVAGAGVGLVAGSSIWLIERTSATVIVPAAVGVMVIADIVARRRGLAAVGSVPLVAFAVVAFAAWWAGRSESPLCDPDSPLQFHGLWHVLSAVLVLAWVARATSVEGTGRPRREVR